MKDRKYVLLFRLVGVGWYIALSIILPLLGGLWLDNKLGTLPLLTLSGIVLGVVLAFYGVYKMVVPILDMDGTSSEKDSRNGGT